MKNVLALWLLLVVFSETYFLVLIVIIVCPKLAFFININMAKEQCPEQYLSLAEKVGLLPVHMTDNMVFCNLL